MVLLLASLFGILPDSAATENFGAWLLLASAFVFGLPHGACDLWILQRIVRPRDGSKNILIGYFLIYLVLAVLTVVVWIFLPGPALIGFLLLTAWHFGSGDAVWEGTSAGFWRLDSIGRGLIVIFAPIAFYPAQSGRILAGLMSGGEPLFVGFIQTAAPLLVSTGIILLLLTTALTLKKDIYRPVFFKWVEIALTLLMFWLTPPLIAIAFYLIGVHSWRHILRLEFYANDRQKVTAEKEIWRVLVNFHRRALPMTVLALFGSIFIFWFWQIGLEDIFKMTYGYLILLSALTVPHAALISWIETRDNLFGVPA